MSELLLSVIIGMGLSFLGAIVLIEGILILICLFTWEKIGTLNRAFSSLFLALFAGGLVLIALGFLAGGTLVLDPVVGTWVASADLVLLLIVVRARARPSQSNTRSP